MKRIFIFALFAVFVLLAQVRGVSAEARYGGREYFIYFPDETSEGPLDFRAEGFEFCGAFEPWQKAFVLFANLADRDFFPDGAVLLDAYFEGDTLILDFSAELLNYGGRSYETALIAALAKTALEIEGANKLSVFVGGAACALSEGSRVRGLDIKDFLEIEAALR